MERSVDFFRSRHMSCTGCGHTFMADLDWIDRWEQGQEVCPGCGVNCEEELAPRVTVDPDDLALIDSNVSPLFWYHTTTQDDWPTLNFNPAAGFTDDTVQAMGGLARVTAWEDRQRRKALHVGTYEAAIHNMLRRIADQADRGKQFYLYRVHLVPAITVRESWIPDPGGFVGDVPLTEVCPPGIDVTRYLNMHEDPGGLSLALGHSAISYVQRILIPLRDIADLDSATSVATDVDKAVFIEPASTDSALYRLRKPPSARQTKAREVVEALAEKLPANLRFQFESAGALDDGARSDEWARYVLSLMDTVLESEELLSALDVRPPEPRQT